MFHSSWFHSWTPTRESLSAYARGVSWSGQQRRLNRAGGHVMQALSMRYAISIFGIDDLTSYITSHSTSNLRVNISLVSREFMTHTPPESPHSLAEKKYQNLTPLTPGSEWYYPKHLMNASNIHRSAWILPPAYSIKQRVLWRPFR